MWRASREVKSRMSTIATLQELLFETRKTEKMNSPQKHHYLKNAMADSLSSESNKCFFDAGLNELQGSCGSSHVMRSTASNHDRKKKDAVKSKTPHRTDKFYLPETTNLFFSSTLLAAIGCEEDIDNSHILGLPNPSSKVPKRIANDLILIYRFFGFHKSRSY
jgi:hypothetical protein